MVDLGFSLLGEETDERIPEPGVFDEMTFPVYDLPSDEWGEVHTPGLPDTACEEEDDPRGLLEDEI